MGITEIAILVAVILSIILHEVAHGYAANWLGDPTAKLAGRLSPNPLVHIDPLGSVIVPSLLFFTGAGILFGWAKPVPYNPYNLSNQKWGESLVAVAGPLTNLLLAVIFAIIIRFAEILNVSESFLHLATYIVFINILLAFFNLIPFPPLDGSKVIQPFLPYSIQVQYRNIAIFMERYGIIVLFVVLFFLFQFIWPVLSKLIVGLGSFLTGFSTIEFISNLSL